MALTAVVTVYAVSSLVVGPALGSATSPAAGMPTAEQVEVDHHGHDLGGA